MSDTHPDIQALFCEAIERESPEELQAYLDSACAGDTELRTNLEELLDSHRGAGNFLGGSASDAPKPNMPLLSEGPGTQIGPYKLLEQIGEGGMGTVFLAEQTQPVRRKVALKVIKAGMDSRQVIARFEAERQALAMMNHSSIAKVLDAGATEAGRPYFVMELVKGAPITEFCDQHRLATRQRLQLFVTVCQAVQHAHQKGLIHRDLKPSNVLVEMHDVVPVPKVIDFGVAKAIGQPLTEKTLHTGFNQLVGTPNYMSPEQAGQSSIDVDTRSDVYSLGVLLYEILTGHTPFESEALQNADFDEMRRMIREVDPPRPSARVGTQQANALSTVSDRRHVDPHKLSQQLRGELDWIVMKALEKDRSRRYESASGFAADVQRYLNDDPVQAGPPSTAYRFRKFAVRNRGAILTAGAVGLALLTGVVLSTWQAIRATRAEEVAETRLEAETSARRQAVADHEQSQRRLYQARLAEARAVRRSGLVGQRFESLTALGEASQLARRLELGATAEEDVRNEAIAALACFDLKLVSEFENSDPSVWLNYDADLEHYANCTRDGIVHVHETATGNEVARMTMPEKRMFFLNFSPDGRFVGIFHYGVALYVWDWRKGEVVVRTSSTIGKVTPFDFSPDSSWLAVPLDKEVCIWDLATGSVKHRWSLDALPCQVAFSPDGRQLAVACRNVPQVQIRDVVDGELLRRLQVPDYPWTMAWHPEGQLLGVACGDSVSYLLDSVTGAQRTAFRGHQRPQNGIGFARETGVACTWTWDPSVRLWDSHSGRELFRIAGTHAKLSRDGRRLACMGGSKIQFWEVAAPEVWRELPNQRRDVLIDLRQQDSQCISPDGRWLAVVGSGGFGLYDLSLGQPIAFVPGKMTDVQFAPGGDAMLITGPRGLQHWPISVEAESVRLGPPSLLLPGSLYGLARFGDGRRVVTANMGRGGAEIWHLDERSAPVHRLPHPQCKAVALSANDRWIATGGHHCLGAKIWNAANGQLVATLLPEQSPVNVCFTPDGRHLVTSGRHAMTWWEVDTWRQQRQVLLAPGGGASCFSSDGKVAAIALSSTRIQVEDVTSGRSLAMLESPDGLSIQHLTFTPNGEQLVTSNYSPLRIQVWNLRLLRRRLADMDIDWNAPPYPPLPTDVPGEIQVELQLVNPVERDAREQQLQGDGHRVQKEYAQAIACYRVVLTSEPFNGTIVNRLAWLLAVGPPSVRDGAEAFELVDRTQALHSDNPYFLNTFAAAHYRAGNYERASSLLHQAEREIKAKKINFCWPHNWLVQALCRAKLGQMDESQAMYDKSIQWLNKPGENNTCWRNEALLLKEEYELLTGE